MGLTFGVRSIEAKPLITTTFYLWFPSPHNDVPNLNSSLAWIYDPPVMDGSNDESYWQRNLSDVVDAGVDGAFLLTYTNPGVELFDPAINKYKDEYSHKYVQLAVDTAKKFSIPIKFGAFVDYYKNEANLEKMFTWNYTHDILPFFRIIPQERWLTHNGLPVNQGGRPVIMFWTIDPHIANQVGSSHVQQIKDHFATDFGVVPFIVMVSDTFGLLSDTSVIDGVFSWGSPIGGRRDNAWKDYIISSLAIGNNEQLIRPWRCHPGINPTDTAYNESPRILLTAAEILPRVTEFPGIDVNRDRQLQRWPDADWAAWKANPASIPGEVEAYRDSYGEEPDEAGFFRANFRAIPGTPSMIFIQDFNELNEGTTWGRAINFPTHDNPIITTCATGYTMGGSLDTVRQVYRNENLGKTDPSKYVADDFYLKAVRGEIEKKFGATSCLTALVPINVKTECSNGKATVTWQDAGGIVRDYLIRLKVNNVMVAQKPEDQNNVPYTQKSITVTANTGDKVSGWMQSRNMCDAISDAVTIPDCPNPADLNHDGKVDIFDYNIVVQNFGK